MTTTEHVTLFEIFDITAWHTGMRGDSTYKVVVERRFDVLPVTLWSNRIGYFQRESECQVFALEAAAKLQALDPEDVWLSHCRKFPNVVSIQDGHSRGGHEGS